MLTDLHQVYLSTVLGFSNSIELQISGDETWKFAWSFCFGGLIATLWTLKCLFPVPLFLETLLVVSYWKKRFQRDLLAKKRALIGRWIALNANGLASNISRNCSGLFKFNRVADQWRWTMKICMIILLSGLNCQFVTLWTLKCLFPMTLF